MACEQLDIRIIFQKVTETITDMGGISQSWADVFTASAKEFPISGREYRAADQVNAQFSTRFRIRYRRCVDETMRIVYEGQHYNIRHITRVGRRQWLDIVAEVVRLNGNQF